ncbi:2Fe-2S iron-sulfur cluster-binding protein [Amylibacter sp. IMCC11727]|uniref:2Fe-2S iron-sulfur cluster-binding protein n=1 Tax=Amylibacter sp. IMCC11727 TaxID=3039851 RepID=UPI00244DA0BF|nr:2Fe-2S iron-sulfur cluster-binding protein [Amylibacter sp. IMCC11727]WGI22091.1 2Fe-2S iron-sulfur cluster-binding protein [Amylibacter sp. IMCC11727]
MAQFHSLKVTDIHKTIRDAVVLTLTPDTPDAFDFTQGQYLTFRRDFDGEELRRSYSICAGKDDGVLQVGIKKVDGGAFSTWANEDLKIGDVLEAMPPMGNFGTELNAAAEKHYLAFAGGSGITPVLSILRTVMQREPRSRFTLVYANRAVNTIMFRSEIEDMKNRFMGRINVVHILEQDAQDIDLFTGRVDGEKCALLFKHWINIDDIDTAYICGPEPMMLAISQALSDHGLSKEQIKFELFASGQPGRAKQKAKAAGAAAVKAVAGKVTLGGESRSFDMSKDMSLLEAALENEVEAPYACKAGVCSTCKCKVLEGEVEMLTNHALEDYEAEAGFVLSCQSYAVTDKVVWDYDEAGH